MTVTLTLKGVLLTSIALLVIVLLIYIIVLIRKLIETLKQVDGILSDTKEVTAVASERVQQVDGMMDELGGTVGVVIDAMKGNQNIVAALTHIVDAASSLIGMIRRKKTECDDGGAEKAPKRSRKQRRKEAVQAKKI